MAMFDLFVPDKEMKEIQQIIDNADEIFGGMTKAAAEAVCANAKGSCPNDKLAAKIRVTKVYKTPSDGGINTKVICSGYLPFEGDRTSFTRKGGNGGTYTTTKGIPAPFLLNMYEYGRSGAPFPRHPFFWSAFKASMIKAIMEQEQKKLSGGILD